jgi:ketosteroid isomerase-like protein
MDPASEALTLVGDWLAAYNEGDWARFRRALAPAVVFRFRAEGLTPEGIEPVMASFTGWRGAFTALEGAIVDGFACGDRAAVELEWAGMSARTGRPIRFPSCWLIAVSGGRLVEIDDYYDQLTYRRQLGEPLAG